MFNLHSFILASSRDSAHESPRKRLAEENRGRRSSVENLVRRNDVCVKKNCTAATAAIATMLHCIVGLAHFGSHLYLPSETWSDGFHPFVSLPRHLGDSIQPAPNCDDFPNSETYIQQTRRRWLLCVTSEDRCRVMKVHHCRCRAHRTGDKPARLL